MKVYTNVDLKKNQLQYAVIHPLSTAPTGVLGQIYYNSTDKHLYQHNGTQWVRVGIAYDLEADSVSDAVILKLIGDNGTTDTVRLVGAGDTTITQNGQEITISSSDTNTTYTFTGTASATNYVITITPSTGTAQTITLSLADATNAGLMSPADFTKLSGIEAGAQVNKNNFSKVKADGTDISATSDDDTFTLEAGTNVTITPDTGNRKATISATDTTYPNGTTAQLEAGVSQTPSTWDAETLHDYIEANGCDCGFTCEEVTTLLFTETITTEPDPEEIYPPYATFTYNSFINAEVIKVTINGTSYIVPRQAFETYNNYGAWDGHNYDWSQYPFMIDSLDWSPASNGLTTEIAGTYTVTVESVDSYDVDTTTCFEEAVKSVGGGGGSYTATSPIAIDGNNDISHEDSGVTAGTYDGGYSKGVGYYVPSVTVDAKGHVTSASDLGNLIPGIHTTNAGYENFHLVGGTQWCSVVRQARQAGNAHLLYHGYTSATFTLYDTYSLTNSDAYYFHIVSVEAVDISTGECVLVDWSTSSPVSTAGKTDSITLTVSIAEPYDHSIAIIPTVAYATAGM